MIVMKFGGSSLKDPERIRHVSEIIKNALPRKPLIVLSAMGSTTNALIEAGKRALDGAPDGAPIKTYHLETLHALKIETPVLHQLLKQLEELLLGIAYLKEISPRTHDFLLSFGERLSVRILSSYLNTQGIDSQPYDSWELGLLTDSTFGKATPHPESASSIDKKVKQLNSVPIVTGFISQDPQGNLTTLGRGGSDLTASLFGAAIHASEIQVWKDVDGILTADPKIVKEARPVKTISFEEASELAYFGAKVLHPLSIRPAMAANIPVIVKNSYKVEAEGTTIYNQLKGSRPLVTALTHKRKITLVDIQSTRMLGQHGFLATLFEVFNRLKISVDVIATSEVSLSLTLDETHCLDALQTELLKIADVTIHQNKSMISIIGDVQRSTTILNKLFSTLDTYAHHVEMLSQGASKVNISFIINEAETSMVLQQLHHTFF